MPDYFEFVAPADLTINRLRIRHPELFYNQDWYLLEEFANRPLDGKRHRISTEVLAGWRGSLPSKLMPMMTAGTATCAFCEYWFQTGKVLWALDYTWTSDLDRFGDRVYVGGYGLSKPGFEIHRHLSLRQCHSVALEIT